MLSSALSVAFWVTLFFVLQAPIRDVFIYQPSHKLGLSSAPRFQP